MSINLDQSKKVLADSMYHFIESYKELETIESDTIGAFEFESEKVMVADFIKYLEDMHL